MGRQKTIDSTVERLTSGPKHHLFGFHDLIVSNREDAKYLCLETDTINRPPLPGELFGVGYVEEGHFKKLGETAALNYPQGARQQWVADTDLFTVNNRVGNVWGTDLYDAKVDRLIDRFPATTHMLSKDGRYAYGLDYARLFRLGGYGYSGITDKGSNAPIPSDSGITVLDLHTKEVRTLVTVRQAAECGSSNLSGKEHHYLTHLCLNPSSTRVAFLHRYFMPDGGMMTRLMTVGTDGNGLRCLAQGFLSHYDWKDESHIYIFGRAGSSVDTLRNKPIMANPLVKYALRFAKKMAKSVVGRNGSVAGAMSFLMIEDATEPTVTAFAKDIIPVDGHPMTNPMNRNWCICDNYPDADGFRDLFLYDFVDDERINLGRFRRLFAEPDMALKDEYFQGVDVGILRSISEEQLAFTRSGLHCDLHPRWSSNGKWAVFDSIHEGTRQIYRVDVSKLMH